MKLLRKLIDLLKIARYELFPWFGGRKLNKDDYAEMDAEYNDYEDVEGDKDNKNLIDK